MHSAFGLVPRKPPKIRIVSHDQEYLPTTRPGEDFVGEPDQVVRHTRDVA
jgi:hypothetical protein